MENRGSNPDINQQPLILCIEDEVDFLENITEELAAEGYRVLSATTGRKALNLLTSHQPDLILCDITMPGLDGYDVMRELRRQSPELAAIPFVFLTARTGRDHVLRGKQAGADDYLVKPVDMDLLLATVATRLSQMQRISRYHEQELTKLRQALSKLHQTTPVQRDDQVTNSALNYVNAAVILLDMHRRVTFANQAAGHLVDVIEGLTLEGAFSVYSRRVLSQLHQAFHDVLSADANEGEDPVVCLTLPACDGRRDLLCVVAALPQERSTPVQVHEPVIMLMISDPEERKTLSHRMLKALFDLTPMEAQVAKAFADGYRSSDIAEKFNISATTVAFHKRNLFQKTQTHRQADLITLLLALPIHLDGDDVPTS